MNQSSKPMALSNGIRVGPYEILAPLGAGGMGEVYRARDTKLNREVAIKVLPTAFAGDAARMARFQREAQLLASLNHPNIASIYGLEESNGVRALVMELVEGPTLADRIQQGPLGLDEALSIARQIADGLEAAHEKGIVHRDLKPGNIKIKPDGTLKVLDFGLAKVAEPSAPERTPEGSPTLTLHTRAGVLLGTSAYMSPEQAQGKPVDKRADIWAFGVVLYEMLAGQGLFLGESTSDTLAAVLTKEPDWNRVPPKVSRLLRRCLEKDPKRRLRDIGDSGLLLEDAPAPAVKASRLWKVAAGVLMLLLAFAIALWEPWRDATRPIEQPLVRLDLDLGPDVSLGSSTGPAVILSPDGDRMVFVSQGQDGTTRLLTRRLDQPKAT